MSAPDSIKSPEQVDLAVDSGDDDEIADETRDSFDVNALDMAKRTPKGATTPSKLASSPAVGGSGGKTIRKQAPGA